MWRPRLLSRPRLGVSHSLESCVDYFEVRIKQGNLIMVMQYVRQRREICSRPVVTPWKVQAWLQE